MSNWFFSLKKGKRFVCRAKNLNKAIDELKMNGYDPKDVVGLKTRASYLRFR